MNIEQLRTYCLSLKGTSEDFPFGEDTLVFRVCGKIFLLAALDTVPLQFNVKCDPERALELREQYPESIRGAYHMNKRHWNTVICESDLSDSMLYAFITDSYRLVVEKLPKALKNLL